MMDRAQFMQELEKLLADISETERQDALDFYNSYFDDAGAENEASVDKPGCLKMTTPMTPTPQ